MDEGAPTWRIGDVVDGRYRVSQVHEQGGMGVVYRVRHLGWDIDLAVKSPRPDLFASPEGQRRFVAEAETWVSLGLHPHVCHCHYVRVLDGVPRVFAEYVPGGTVHDWINDRRLYEGEPPEVLARILDIAIQTAWGLHHAHDHGLVHRDVKPANILLDPDGDTVTAKITDFGLARARDLAATAPAGAPPGASIPVPGGSAMTPRYASPEQTAGEPVGRRTDTYSLAVSLLEMLIGEATWMAGPVAGAALTAYRAGEMDAAVVLPPALGDLLQKCLRNEPDDRPDSLADVSAELIDIHRRTTGHAYPRAAPVAAELLADELNNRAVSLLDLDRHAEANEAFAQALAADPQHPRARYNAGVARWRRGEITDDALVAEIEAARAGGGDPWETRYTLAQVHLERGDLEAARELLDEAARERPDEPDVLAARHAIRSGEIADARCTREWPLPWSPDDDRVRLAMTPDGRFVLAGGWDGAIRLFDVHIGRCVRTLETDHGYVAAVDLTPDGRVAAWICADETVWCWDLREPSPRGLPTPDPGAPMRDWSGVVRLTPDGRLALCDGPRGGLRLWNLHNGQVTTLDRGATEGRVAVSADGRRALSAGRSSPAGKRIVRLWDLADGRCERELPVPESFVTALCFSADDRYVAVDCFEGPIQVWDLRDGRCVHTLSAGRMQRTVRGAHGMSLSAGARFLLTGSGALADDDVRVWELAGRRCVRTFRGHRGGTSVVHLDAQARGGLSIGADRTVRWWTLPGRYEGAPRLSRPRRHVELNRLGDQVAALVAGAERATAAGRYPEALDQLRQARAIAGYERAPRVMSAWWALGRRAERTALRTAWASTIVTGDADLMRVGDLSADGRIAVSGGVHGTIRLWDTGSGRCLRVLEGHRYRIGSVCLSADGQWVLSAAIGEGSVRLWEVATGACRHVLPGNADSRSAQVRFSADGRQAVVGDPRGQIRCWDLRSGHLTQVLDKPPHPALDMFDDMCLADDGRLAATVTRYRVELWDLAEGRITREFALKRSPLPHGTVSLSADGRYAVGGNGDALEHTPNPRFAAPDDLDARGGIQLWDTTTGAVIRTFDPAGGYTNVRLTADGRFAIADSRRSHLTIWDVHTGQRVRVLDGPEPGEACLAVTPDGRFVLGCGGGTLRLWELDWDLAAHEPADWHAGATPYLEAFVRRHGPQWTSGDVEVLLHRLQDAGYGWLRAEGVRARLDRMR